MRALNIYYFFIIALLHYFAALLDSLRCPYIYKSKEGKVTFKHYRMGFQ